MEESRLKFAEDEQPPAGQEAPARRMEAAAPKPGAGRPTKRRRMEIARAAGARLQTEKPRQTSSRLIHEALPQAGEEVHRQIRRVEDDNTGVQAAHETEQGAESGVGLVVRSARRARLNASRHTEQTAQIAAYATYDPAQPMSLRPKKADVLVDRQYILAAMGLLSTHVPKVALSIMKKELECHGSSK